jgi:myo-inositol-1(or 4)-monophosphatase
MSLNDDLQYAIKIARDAGKLILELWGKVERLTKNHIAASNEAVTDADRASQRLIVAALKGRFPRDGIVGEESDSGSSITVEVTDVLGRNWVIDPIDGTNNFIAGYGAFCVCIGLLEGGEPVLGVVYDVTRDEMYSAARGFGAWKDARRIRVSERPLDDAGMIMLTSNVIDNASRAPGWINYWMSQTKLKSRILGSAALEAVHVASGVAHGAITVNGKLWDCAAPAAIVLEAGGVFTDLKGKDIFPFDLSNYTGAKVPFLAAAPVAHKELLQTMLDHP